MAATETPTTTAPVVINHRFASLPVPPPANENEVYDAACFPDTTLFRQTTTNPALVVPVKETATTLKKLKSHLIRGQRNVFPADDGKRLIVLHADVSKEKMSDTFSSLLSFEHSWTTHETVRDYKDQTAGELLRQLLPSPFGDNPPTAFEQVGHIAHLNLSIPLLPFSYWIGRIVLDCHHPRIQTVVNKSGVISNEFRTFPMTVVAGNDQPGWSVATCKENGFTYRLDYATVYWNSRLSHEHERVVELIGNKARQKPLIVADWMAGVGPFAIPLACAEEGNITIHANDLNPASYQYLQENKLLNPRAVNKKEWHAYNMDARAFCRHLYDEQQVYFDVAILNLPATAVEFLDVLSEYSWPVDQIYVYAFAAKGKEDTVELKERCQAALGTRHMLDLQIHIVRNVSPQQNMYCIQFRLGSGGKKQKTEK